MMIKLVIKEKIDILECYLITMQFMSLFNTK